MRIQISNNHGTEIVPCLSLVMEIEEAFGPISKILERIREKDTDFETIVKIFKSIGMRAGATWPPEEIEENIRRHGTYYITTQVVRVLSACMIGEIAVAEFFEDIPGLGKP